MAKNKRTRKYNTKSKKVNKKNDKKEHKSAPGFMKDEIIILLSFAICIFLFISNFGIGGSVGDSAAHVLFGLFGYLAYITPVLVFIGITFLLSNKRNAYAYIKFGAFTLLFVMCCTIFQLVINGEIEGADFKMLYTYGDGGGALGGLIVNKLSPMIGTFGTYVIVIILTIISFVIITGKSFVGAVKTKSEKVYQTAKEDVKRKKELAEIEREKRAQEETKREEPKEPKRIEKVVSGVSFDTTLEREEISDVHEITPPENAFTPEDIVIKRAASVEEEYDENYDDEIDDEDDSEVESTGDASDEFAIRKRRSTKESRENAAVEATNVENEIKKAVVKPKKIHKYPPISLLAKGKALGGDSDSQLREIAQKLEQTLRNFNVNVTVTNVSCGPSVTRYELQPEQGVKVSKIVGLADDIKLNLAASDIRIEAPIPGKAAVGIEVPNETKQMVRLRDILESNEFKDHKSKLAFAVGRDIAGKAIVGDVAKMPHVLIAGTTGSGKSVCISSLIMSILFNASPEEVKLIMVDPKQVELKVYNGIPHLLIPVVTDPKKAAGALNWAVVEMSRRYEKFAECNVRDIKTYNAKIDALEGIEDENKPEKMPQIVIVVDELADLMMVAPGEVEDAICRLAQLARACGIHLVLATQRPSVDVVTGLIKANMPSRIALSLKSGVDSRTILDMNGAEKLLGNGDMLFYPAGYTKPTRIQGTYVTDEEIQSVVDFLKNNTDGTVYDEEITNQINSARAGSGMPGNNSADEKDVYFVDAAKFVIEKDKASIGSLQRVFKIGFNRAARIMDQLAEAGVVGEEEGTKPRKVLMSLEQLEQYIDEYL